jgi:hypothetical protein
MDPPTCLRGPGAQEQGAQGEQGAQQEQGVQQGQGAQQGQVLLGLGVRSEFPVGCIL